MLKDGTKTLASSRYSFQELELPITLTRKRQQKNGLRTFSETLDRSEMRYYTHIGSHYFGCFVSDVILLKVYTGMRRHAIMH